MPVAGAIVAAPVAGGIIGGIQSSAARKQAADAEQAALQQYLNIHVPDPAQQAVILKQYQQTGQISPQIQKAIAQQQSELKGMKIDPTSREAEIQALNQMQNVASNGGMDAQARQQEAQALNTSNANEAGQQGAIMQNYAARGIGGSGAQLAAQLSADQGSANSGAAAGMNSAAGAEQRALQAMTSGASMASNLNSQDYGQAAQAATAQDAINRFNAQNAQGAEKDNTQAINNAQAQNTVNNQNLSNANVGISNQQETQNKGLIQQNFGDQMQLATGRANAENGVANQANSNANTTANQWANIGSATAQAGATLARSNKSSDDSDTETEE